MYSKYEWQVLEKIQAIIAGNKYKLGVSSNGKTFKW
jgi:hypothetical protein